MNGQGLAIRNGAAVTKKVQPRQFYPTPDDGTVDALLDACPPPKGMPIWEPCVGKGHITHVLNRRGFDTVHSDIHDYGEPGLDVEVKDFRDFTYLKGLSIITNPPYDIGHEFVRHALSLNPRYMALLLKADFFNSIKGLNVFNTSAPGHLWHPSAVLPLTWRPDFMGQGKPFLTVSWFVWDAGHVGKPIFFPLARPKRVA